MLPYDHRRFDLDPGTILTVVLISAVSGAIVSGVLVWLLMATWY